MRAPLGVQTMGSATKRAPQHLGSGQHSEGFSIDLSKTENYLLDDELADICESAADDVALSNNPSRHGEMAGSKLLNSLARLFNNYFNTCTTVSPSQIAPAAGPSQALDALLQSICEPGDGVLIPGPYWDGFEPQSWAAASVQGVTVHLPICTDNFTRKLVSTLSDAMERSSCRIRAVLMTNPHIPFGQCYPREVLEACVKFCELRGIEYISDEGYGLTLFPCAEISDPEPFISALSLDARELGCDQSRIHVVWSINKDFGSSGFHMGCSVTQGNDAFVAQLTRDTRARVSPSSAAFATALLLSPNLPFLIAVNSARLAESYILITTFFVRYGIKYIPTAAGLTVFARLDPRARTWDDEAAMVARLRDAGVIVTAGRQYDGIQKEKGWARISFSVKQEQLREALRRMEIALGLR